MWPRSKEGTIRYRNWLRHREAALIADRVRRRFPRLGDAARDPLILEFGSGEGHQLPVLRELGRVVATDVYINPHLRLARPGDPFLVCDITRPPFRVGTFDLIFSNHVLEHIPDLDRALDEVQRIAAPNCVYAFSVPTPLWLFLSIPMRYLDKIRRVFGRLFGRRKPKATVAANRLIAEDNPNKTPEKKSSLAFLLPGGHGEYPGFWQAVLAFRKSEWLRRFDRHGFRVVEYRRLMLYANARWPWIPANTILPCIGLASSQLFLLESDGSGREPKSGKGTA
ncbi:MAG: class I SAM-dependent methyltransferase [Phycisphaerales bacterium]|nr:class I SAM-dependent methyltransferase [Phycisphaerales bacterium]